MAVATYPMSYNPANITLTVWGNSVGGGKDIMGHSAATAFDWDDIKEYLLWVNTDLGIDICREDGYEFDCVFQFILDPVYGNTTYFKDGYKAIKIDAKALSMATYSHIWIKTGVNFNIGTVTNETDKTSIGGCYFYFTANTNISYGGCIKHQGIGGIYSSFLQINPARSSLQSVIAMSFSSTARLWNSILEGGAIRAANVVTDFYNLTIADSYYGLYYSMGSFDKIQCYDLISVAHIRNVGYSSSLRNAFVRKCTYMTSIQSDVGQTAYSDFTDCDLGDAWGNINGLPALGQTINVYRRYTVNFKVVDSSGTSIQGAIVKIYDQYNRLICEKTTDVDGLTTDTVLLIYNWLLTNPSGVQIRTETDYNPFKFVVSKALFETYTLIIDVEKEMQIRCTLSYPELLISAVTITDCATIGASDGQLEITAQGGDGSYTYSINGVDYQAGNTFSGLSAGDYTVYVKDVEDTVADFDVRVEEPVLFDALCISNILITHPEIIGGVGSLSITGSGGTAPYQYSLDGINYQNENTFSNLTAGIYNCYIKDADNSVKTFSAEIKNPVYKKPTIYVKNSISTGLIKVKEVSESVKIKVVEH